MMGRKSLVISIYTVILTSISVRALSFSKSSSSVQPFPSSSSSIKPKPHAIVVGGGPIGLASALTLAFFHSYDVTVYESAPYDVYSNFDPSKAFLYLISGRGQAFTTKFPDLQRKLIERGVPSSTPFTSIPADINTPIPIPDESLIVKNADFGEENVDKVSNGNKSVKEKGKKVQEIMGYWIPRHEMNLILFETIQEIGRKEAKNENVGKITCHFGVSCTDIQVSDDQTSIKVTSKDTKGITSETTANLVVAGDGNKSKVREILSNQNPTSSSFKALDSKFNPKNFKVRQWVSPATNLRLKALQLPPKFPILQDGEESYISKGQISYSINGKNKGPRNFFKLGCLPMKNDNLIRPANVISRPDHDIWKLTKGEDVRKYMQNNFPRMQFQPETEGGIISDAEWDRFAKAQGLSFPCCQYSPGLVVSSNDDDGEAMNYGVVLLGDAAHSFPPDTGQGINAGLSDVLYLDQVLKNDGKPVSLSKALRQYQKERGPETKALIRLARFGFPYQYSQPHYIDRIRKKLCLINFAIRLLLNKVTAGLAPKPAIMMAMDRSRTYRQIMRKADSMTALLTSLFIVFLVKKIRSFLF